jgi:invasion protein IalB
MLCIKFRAVIALIAISFGLSLLLSAEAVAQRVPANPPAEAAGKQLPRVGERIGDWTFRCQALTASETRCSISQVAFNPQKKPVVRATFLGIGKNKKLGLVVLAPLGIFLGTGVAGKIDEGKQFKFVLQRCSQQGCRAAIEVSDKMRSALQKGSRLALAFKMRANANAVLVPISLKGFTKALNALKIK